MTITIADIKNEIKRHLSVIGKRLYTKDGKNMFSDITVSSAEEPILVQYITTSAHDIEAALKQLITSATYSGNTTITIEIQNTRGDIDFGVRVKDLSEGYITLNAVGEYLSMTHPDLAQMYRQDAQKRMSSLIEYVYYKKPPQGI